MHQRAILRPYQLDLKRAIYNAWMAGHANVLAVLPTGAGKTITFSDIIHDHDGASCAIAHRQELVLQISLALARDHVRHRIIGPHTVVKLCVAMHMEEIGVSYYDPNSPCAVAGVDTLVRRKDGLADWLQSVTLWVQDEAHHVLRKNKWGKAVALFPNAKGLGVTATPLRADGNGLGRHADGVFDTLIEGPGMRPLINAGYLAEYRIFAPVSDIDLTQVPLTAGGEYNPQKLKQAARKSRIVGDVVEQYLKIAAGKLGVTFATDVETAKDIAMNFRHAGVPAEAISAETSDSKRGAALRCFRRGELKQLVNVDLFGEGFDVPSIEVGTMARPTHSYGYFVQQFGRILRPLEGKKCGILIDQVENVIRHGLPDVKKDWTLDRREKRNNTNNSGIPLRACPACTSVYERTYKACPFCGFVPVPVGRGSPEQVDGDLCELSPEILAIMRGEIEAVDMDKETYRSQMAANHVPEIGQMANVKRHVKRQEGQAVLRSSIAWWAGYQRAAGRADSDSYRLFYHTFGVDVLTAQTLKMPEATSLCDKINRSLMEFVV